MTTFAQSVAETQTWLDQPRFARTVRLHTARDIAEQQGSIRQDYAVARDAAEGLYGLLRELFASRTAVTTFGPYSPGQAVVMKRLGIPAIYLGGWATSAKGSATEDPGPDLASYPLSAVPDEAAAIVRALLTADRNQHFGRARMTDAARAEAEPIDFRPFIIADADTGHGGEAHVRNLIRRFVEVGVPGYHIEDQKPGVKKCGHQAGKVLVAQGEQHRRLNAARFQLDVMRVPGIIVARTDAESATYLDDRIDERDHPFLLGATASGLPTYRIGYVAVLRLLEALGQPDVRGHLLYGIGSEALGEADAWLERVGLRAELAALPISPEAQESAAGAYAARWEAAAGLMTAGEASAAGLPWDPELPRTPDGFFLVRGGIDFAIARSIAAAPFADLLWMETKTADLEDAARFAEAVHAVHPDAMLAYNLSPSFNWDTTGMTDAQMRDFPAELGRLGYVFDFITYGGHQIDGLAAEEFATSLTRDGMLALARLQRSFRLRVSPYRTPQSLVGGDRLDATLMATSGRTAATRAMGAGSTQHQHLATTEVPIGVLDGWLAEWAELWDYPTRPTARLRPRGSGTDALELHIEDEAGAELATLVVDRVVDREGRVILTVRDQITATALRRRRLQTLAQLFLIHRFGADAVHYLAPTPDNAAHVLGMQTLGIFAAVSRGSDQLIAAQVDRAGVATLTGPDGGAARRASIRQPAERRPVA
jgi:isocitrate lyase